MPFLIISRHRPFVATIRNGNHIRGFVDAALQISLVPSFCWVWVWWIVGVVARDTICGESAVRAVDGVEEGIKKAREVVVRFVVGVVCLEDNAVLRPDYRVGDLEIEVGFGTGIDSFICGRRAAVNALDNGRCSIFDCSGSCVSVGYI